MPRRPARRPARRPKRKGNRRSRVPRALRSQFKTYDYTFNLDPQTFYAALGGTIPVLTAGPTVPIPLGSGSSPTGGWNIVSNTALGSMPGYSDVTIAVANQLSDLSNAANFQAIYDAYKINSVTASVHYIGNFGSGFAAIVPQFYVYWDQDDAVTPANINQILGKTGVKRWQPTQAKSRMSLKYTPMSRNTANNAATTNLGAIVANKSQWMNCTYPSVPLYGLKIYVADFYAPMTPASQGHAFKVQFKYNVSFRAPVTAT